MKINIEALALKAGFEDGGDNILFEGVICTDEVRELVYLVLREVASHVPWSHCETLGQGSGLTNAILDMMP